MKLFFFFFFNGLFLNTFRDILWSSIVTEVWEVIMMVKIVIINNNSCKIHDIRRELQLLILN